MGGEIASLCWCLLECEEFNKVRDQCVRGVDMGRKGDRQLITSDGGTILECEVTVNR